jgi:hypothetical protein
MRCGRQAWSMVVTVDDVSIYREPIALEATRAQAYARQCVLSMGGDTKSEGVVGGVTPGGPVQVRPSKPLSERESEAASRQLVFIRSLPWHTPAR